MKDIFARNGAKDIAYSGEAAVPKSGAHRDKKVPKASHGSVASPLSGLITDI